MWYNVDVLAPTVTTLEPDPENGNPSTYGDGLTFVATVGAQAPATGTPTGSVDFTDTFTDPTTGAITTTDLGQGDLSSGEATLYVSTLAVGDHSIIATYFPDARSSLVFAGSLSTPRTQEVNVAPTEATLSSTPTTVTLGEHVAMSATVAPVCPAPGLGTPTGSVDFTDTYPDPSTGEATTANLGSETLASGVATVNVPMFAVGENSITATYVPDAASDAVFAGIESAPITEQVNPAPTTTVVTASENPATYGDSVQLTACVTTDDPASGTPTGAVDFFDAVTQADLGPGVPDGNPGEYTLSTAALPAGHNYVTAGYYGDVTHARSNSTAVDVVIKPLVDLQLGNLGTETFNDVTKQTVGGLVTVPVEGSGQQGIVQDITLTADAGLSGSIRLTRSSDKVALWSPQTRAYLSFDGSDNVFLAGQLPVEFVVSGVSGSDDMRDVTLTESVADDPNDADTVNFTVLLIDAPTINVSGPTSPQDGAPATVARLGGFTLNSGQLGLGWATRWGPPGGPPLLHMMGIAFEAQAAVHPADFDASLYEDAGGNPIVTIQLDRNADSIWYGGVAGSDVSKWPANQDKTFNASIPPGNDTSLPYLEDDDPSSSGGSIFDLDMPAWTLEYVMAALNKTFGGAPPANLVLCVRSNYEEFATVTITGAGLGPVMASWYTTVFVPYSIWYNAPGAGVLADQWDFYQGFVANGDNKPVPNGGLGLQTVNLLGASAPQEAGALALNYNGLSEAASPTEAPVRAPAMATLYVCPASGPYDDPIASAWLDGWLVWRGDVSDTSAVAIDSFATKVVEGA